MASEPVKPFAIKVTYTKYQKNKYRNDLRWYVRVNEKGEKPFDVCLNSTDESVADRWIRMRNNEVQAANDYAADEDVNKWNTAIAMVVCQRNRNRSTTALTKTKDTTDSMTIKEAVNKYLDYCENVKKLRDATVRDYNRVLSTIIDRLAHQEPPTHNLNQLRTDVVEKLFTEITPKVQPKRTTHSGSLAQHTVRSYMGVLKRFTLWCARRYKIDDPCENLERVKCDQLEHTEWTFDQMMLIVHSTESLPLKCYYYTLATTGCRGTELRCCKWSDIKGSLDEGFHIQLKAEYCKSRKGRILPITPPLAELFGHLRVQTQPAPDDDLFKGVAKSIAARNETLQKLLKKLNLPYGSLHTFRHSLAAYLFKKKKMDIKQVQALLGHASAQTTLNIYIECMKDDEMKSVMANVFDDENNMPSQMSLPEIMALF